MHATRSVGFTAAFMVLASATPATAGPPVAVTSRVSRTVDSGQSNGDSYHSAVSFTGRYVAFVASATDLVPGDLNGRQDVFVRDRTARTTERVSVSSDEVEATSDGVQPSISADGRLVAFASDASNLVPDDPTGNSDVFVRDRTAGTTTRISLDPAGQQSDGDSFEPSISADGSEVAFASDATDLVADDTNGVTDIFVATLATGTIVRASVGVGGQADDNGFTPALSGDGHVVVWSSRASTLVPADTDGLAEVFARDLVSGTTSRISVGAAGVPGDDESGLHGLALSSDGRFVVYSSLADNLVSGDSNAVEDVFVRDRQAGSTRRASVRSDGQQGNAASGFIQLSISANGRLVAFPSGATNLVSGDTNGFVDVFVHDQQTGLTVRASVNSLGLESRRGGVDPAIAGDGTDVVFHSLASNLTPNDTNRALDVFARSLL